MKRLVIAVSLSLLLFGAPLALAGSEVPNMVGTWTVKSEAGLMVRGSAPASTTHHKDAFSALDAEATITKQQGKIFFGTFKSSRASEDFVAAVGHDNKSFIAADTDGSFEGKIVNNDTMEVIYRHVNPSDTVIAIAIWTRKK
jgi:hypothetical protein